MKYMITWSLDNPTYVAAIQRFLKTGAPPPAGVKMLGRYHSLAASSSGFILAESQDPKAIYAWVADWTDVVAFEVVPVIEDAEACQLAAELAELTGDSMRLAIVTALREERDRALARRRRHERIMAITREIALSAA